MLPSLGAAAGCPAFAAERARRRAGAPRPAPPSRAKPDPAKGDTLSTPRRPTARAARPATAPTATRRSPANPKLAQQHPEYLVKQLQEFKSGKRTSADHAAASPPQLSDDDMRNIAWFVGSKKAKPGFAKDKELVALGERIYRGGIADRQIAACAGCHSPNGAGIPAQYPRLGGQHADYTAAQLDGLPRRRAARTACR